MTIALIWPAARNEASFLAYLVAMLAGRPARSPRSFVPGVPGSYSAPLFKGPKCVFHQVAQFVQRPVVVPGFLAVAPAVSPPPFLVLLPGRPAYRCHSRGRPTSAGRPRRQSGPGPGCNRRRSPRSGSRTGRPWASTARRSLLFRSLWRGRRSGCRHGPQFHRGGV